MTKANVCAFQSELKSKIDSYQSVLLDLRESDLPRNEKKRRIKLTNRRIKNIIKQMKFKKKGVVDVLQT